MTLALGPGFSGIGFDRREAMRALAALPLGAAALATLGGCGTSPAPAWPRRPLVLTLGLIVLPFTRTAGAATEPNADFVLRAVDAGMMGVRGDLVERVAADLARLSPTFLTDPPAHQARIVEALDRETFAAPKPIVAPWHALKALILMSYYTSEAGMRYELRYELVPGRYDADIIIDRSWRPLSNDWSAVAVRKPIAPR